MPLWAGVSTAPLYAAADLGRAVSRLPATYLSQSLNNPFIQSHQPRINDEAPLRSGADSPSSEGITTGFAGNHRNSNQDAREWVYRHSGGLANPNAWEWVDRDALEPMDRNLVLSKIYEVVPGSVRVVSTPLLDMVGKGAWDNMLRRTRTVFESPVTNGNDPNNSLPSTTAGGLSLLMDALSQLNETRDRDGKPPLRFTLIGHSMGAIIMNELIQRYDHLDIREIVFMAAACTVGDLDNSVLPYLEKNKNCQFYNLSLHPYGDRQEDIKYNLLPRGSLLDWIDDFASEPTTRREHTLGKWNNIMRMAHTFNRLDPDVLSRIHLKGFAYQRDNPREHGDFNNPELKFWKPDFWIVPEPPTIR